MRLLSKSDVLIRVGVSFATIWKWMLEGKFPRARMIGGIKSCWLASEVEEWMTNLPVRPIKGEPGASLAHEPYNVPNNPRRAGKKNKPKRRPAPRERVGA
jgi:predicted DNA-binding transcriptional regulator AlpA